MQSVSDSAVQPHQRQPQQVPLQPTQQATQQHHFAPPLYAPSQATTYGSNFSTASGAASQASRAVNRMQALFNISDLDFADEPNEIRMMTLRRSLEEFRLDDTDDDEQWTLAPGVSFNDEFHVRTVHASECTVILDSGADVSCIPPSFAECGRGASSRPLQVQDAQGATMKVKAERLIDFVVSDGDEGEVTIRERCIVADVTEPLLSLGRLLKRGWFPAKDSGSLWLHHESTGTSVPMGFKGMSLSMQASIRRVDVEEFRVQEANAVSAPSSPLQKADAAVSKAVPCRKQMQSVSKAVPCRKQMQSVSKAVPCRKQMQSVSKAVPCRKQMQSVSKAVHMVPFTMCRTSRSG